MVQFRSEIILFSSVAVIALFSLNFPGAYFPGSVPVDPFQKKITGVADIRTPVIDRTDENNIVFRGGYAGLLKNPGLHSDFYNGNIKLKRTSVYWKFPSDNSQSLLIAENDKEGWNIQFYLKDEIVLPVISVILKPEDFFSYENGIYVEGYDADFIASKKFYPMPWHQPANYYRKKNDKRKVFFSYYDKNGKVKYSSYAYAEINGGATRCFPQKSLRLTADKDLGNKKFNYDFFSDKNQFKSIVLRNGGNDNTKSLFRDMLMQNLMAGSGLTTSGFIPCTVYLNGVYWGIHFIQNKMDRNFIAEKFKAKEKNVTIVENWKLDKGSEMEYKKLMKLVAGNDGQMKYEAIKENIDVDNLAAYLAGQIYFANTDWPENNLKMYRVKSKKADSKWRFAFFDLDYGFGYTGQNAYDMDMFAFLLEKKDHFSILFRVLMKEKDFKNLLLEKIITLLNTSCLEENMIKLIDKYEESIAHSAEAHFLRWQKPATVNEWKSEVEILRDFSRKRNEVINKQVKKYLK